MSVSHPRLQVVWGGVKDLWPESAHQSEYQLSTFSVSLDQATYSDPFTFAYQEEGLAMVNGLQWAYLHNMEPKCDQNPPDQTRTSDLTKSGSPCHLLQKLEQNRLRAFECWKTSLQVHQEDSHKKVVYSSWPRKTMLLERKALGAVAGSVKHATLDLRVISSIPTLDYLLKFWKRKERKALEKNSPNVFSPIIN